VIFLRIGKFLAHAGVCTRREAADFLKKNLVSLNGEKIVDLNFQIRPDASLEINGKPVGLNQTEIVLLNKPKGYVCTHREQKDQQSIFRLLPDTMSRYFFAGRLDEESRGLVVLSNDGDLIYRLSHPSQKTVKKYHAHSSRPLSDIEIEKIRRGVWSKKEKLNVDSIEPLTQKADYEICLHEGKNREIRRIFEALGLSIIDLCRISIADYTIDGIEEGKYTVILNPSHL
jgi:23S rRNA pseudouridine2605 synthase